MRDRLQRAVNVLAILMLIAFRLHHDTIGNSLAIFLAAVCLVIVYIDLPSRAPARP